MIHHHFAKGRFTSATSATTAGSVNALEEWLTNFPAKMGPIASGKEDGWNYHSFRLTEGDEIFVTGWIMRDGKAAEAVLLRNRPVAAEARFGN